MMYSSPFTPPRVTMLMAAAWLAAAETARAAEADIELGSTSTGGEQVFSPTAGRSWRDHVDLDVTATTHVPLSVGPELGLELPGRILARVHLGWMPQLYSDTLTSALEDAGVYDRDVGALVDGSFRSARSWRLAAGWRPFPDAGLELTLGYVHVSLDGFTRTPEVMRLVPAELAKELDSAIGDTGLDLDSSIHHLTVNVGWRWLIADRVVIGASVGYLQAFDSSSELQIESSARLSRLTTPIVSGVLHEHYMRYVKIPVVGLGVGFRFF